VDTVEVAQEIQGPLQMRLVAFVEKENFVVGVDSELASKTGGNERRGASIF
jgi:hypothetical protein